jgi:homopolymeric O-antigen transport system ATP-binding protein
MHDLEFRSVSKCYQIAADFASPAGRLRKLVSKKPTAPFWAVQDVSFDVEHGEALGMIGHNGAGKSTVLKMISGITRPTRGEIRISGRLSALLEVGSGFHPELTGRENVFLSGSILGMKRREIRSKLDQIVEFAGVEQFIDMPVKRYSSGMFVRLGFSVAAHLEPHVLLVDEVLAVGDAAFQKKCTERILALKRDGTTIIFISHDLAAVERLCDRVAVMHHGKLVFAGQPHKAIGHYHNLTDTPIIGTLGPVPDAEDAVITSVVLLDENGQPSSQFSTGGPLRARVNYRAHRPLENVRVGLFVFSATSTLLHCEFLTEETGHGHSLDAGEGSIEFWCDEVGLQSGPYLISASIEGLGLASEASRRVTRGTIYVRPAREITGLFHNPYRWKRIL